MPSCSRRSEDAVAKERTGALLQIEIMSRAELEDCPQWQHLYAHERKDRRYYEIVEDTIDQGFDYGYFVLKDEAGQIRAIQPFFVNDQDMLGGDQPADRKIDVPSPAYLAAAPENADIDGRMCGWRRAS